MWVCLESVGWVWVDVGLSGVCRVGVGGCGFVEDFV